MGSARQETTRHHHEGATVRVGITTAIPAVLRSLGADPAEVLAEAGVELKLFDDPDNLISIAARGRVFDRCVARTGCKHFGLLIGQTGRLSSLGLIGFLAQHSPDVGTALRSLVRYAHLHVRGAVVNLAVQGNLAFFSYDIHEQHVQAADQAGDGAMAMFFNVMRTLCGPGWRPTEVLFAHRKPDDVGPFRRHFRVPLRFGAEHNALVFSTQWLNCRLPSADPELQRHLQKQLDALDARHREDFPEQVRSVLRSALLTGHVKVDQVAALFSMHSRTLNRRLSAFGTSFQKLLDEGRFEIARQMLEDSAIPVTQIAASLDYADPSAFTRAFRRWSGTTPALWRAVHGARGATAGARRR
jgi:AraC-like DNA-binding protein